MGALAILRERLDAVRRKIARRKRLRGEKKADAELSAEEEVLRGLLERREVFRVHVHKADDIAALLRLADEFGLRVTCEHTSDVHEIGVYRELARRGIPVVYGPLDSFQYKVEVKHESWRNVKLLVDSGARFGLMSDHPITLQRSMRLGLRWLVRAGMSRLDAVGIVTKANAGILGVDRVLGTLARGKWASFVCWNGDPFDLGSWPVAVWGEGKKLYSEEDG